MRRAVLVIAVVFLAGCATVPPELTGRLDQAQRFADDTMRAFGGPSVRIYLGEPTVANATGEYRSGMIILTERAAGGRWLFPLLAHELAHATLGHVGQSPHQELDANARAVEILMRIRQYPEPQAARQIGEFLVAISDEQARLARGRVGGHAHPCDELRDLERRYPGAWSTGLRCVEAR